MLVRGNGIMREGGWDSKSRIHHVPICSKDIVLEDQSLIHVYFNDLVSTLYRKNATQNWLGILGQIGQPANVVVVGHEKRFHSFAASFGGLLGLLLGFSFVTGFELVYFFTIRPLLDHLMQQRRTATVRPT